MLPFNWFVALSFLFFSTVVSDDDCIWCSLGNAIGDGAMKGAEWLWDGAVDATEAVEDLILPPNQPQPNPSVQPDPTITEDQGPQPTDDRIPLAVSATQDQKPPALTDDECDPGKPVGDLLGPNSCGVATKKIIWPTSCGDVVANTGILNALIAIKSAEEVGISSNLCGTFFWTASLTREQVEKLTRDAPGIYNVVPDTTGHWRSIERRDTVVVERDASPDLSYISTPPLTPNLDHKYAHFSNAGAGVRVYIIDSGADPTIREFTANKVIKGYMYGLGSRPKKAGSDTDHGTCMASKVGGIRDGVSRKADLIIIQIEVEISSLLDGIQKVLDECRERADASRNVRGYTVAQIAVGHLGPPSGTNEMKLIGLIQELVELYQVIVVLASESVGYEFGGPDAVDIWNHILHQEPVIPVVLVGAVDMRTGNPADGTTTNANDLTVTAPDSGYCADSRWWNLFGRQIMQGNSVASAAVSGLAADLLSRIYIRDHLGLDLPENQNSIALIFRNYLVSKAFTRRQGTALCVWNGLYFNNPLRIEP